MVQEKASCIIIGDKKVLQRAIDFCKLDLIINVVDEPMDGKYEPGILNLIDLQNISMDQLKMGEVQGMTGRASYEYIKKATELCLDGKADVLTTTAINKESLKAGKVP